MFIKRFEELDKDQYPECGGKAAHLGELTNLKLPVPAGFSVLGIAFNLHLKANRLEERIHFIAEKINYEDFQDLEEKTGQIRGLISGASMPAEIEEEVVEHYGRVDPHEKEPFVAVRSSVAVRDSSISSFPGMMDTFHYIRGPSEVVRKVKQCWGSVWSARAAFARHSKGIDHRKAIIAPTIQRMVNSEVAGVLFTMNPINGLKGEIVIESNWGLGETVVCGKCNSDLYVVDKLTGQIKDKRIARKERTYVQGKDGGATWSRVEAERMEKPTLTDRQIEELCRLACIIEDHYGYPQDIEWAYEKGNLYVLQARRAKAGRE